MLDAMAKSKRKKSAVVAVGLALSIAHCLPGIVEL
jgi:hypothetical protein